MVSNLKWSAMAGTMFDQVLIVGGTGMLLGTSTHIAGRCNALFLACRQPDAPAEKLDAEPVHLDWTDRNRALRAVERLPVFDLLLSWVHKNGLWLIPHLEGKLAGKGRSVRVHGSAALDAHEFKLQNSVLAPDIHRQHLVLGWEQNSKGRRWLRHAEISSAAIALIAQPDRKTMIAGSCGGMRPDLGREED